jgi:hypothetical protein
MSPAEDAPAAAAVKPAVRVAPRLPVTHVTLYSSGVGYFQREGEVEGDARVDLAFPVQDVNDLLKSMVLEDRSGGTVSAASYDSQDPMDKALGSFAVNLASNPSFAELLQQARGEKVEVLLNKATAPLTGTIIGIEPGFKELLISDGQWGAPMPIGPPVVAGTARASCLPPVVAYYQRAGNARPPLAPGSPLEAALTAFASEPARLNLWCAEGLRSIPLTEVQRVRFVSPGMDREVCRALEVLAGAHDTQKRAVSLRFTGEGKRKVRVGYVVESPLWRTSYRLLIRDGGKLYLQGWAVVENPTSEDWKDVRLALVSGCPISFKMDLSQPLYRQRPTVQPNVYGVVPPTTHGMAVTPLATGGLAGLTMGVPTPGPAAAPMPGAVPTPQAQIPPQLPVSNGAFANAQQQVIMPNGVVAAATGAEMGDFFQYEIKHAVSLPRQKSAMLPIVSKAIAGDRVSLYNPSTHAKFPLLALRVKNTSGVHLMQGPVAIFEGAGYAGDAHLLDLRPGEDRLVSYAVDLGTEVEPQAASTTTKLTSIKIQKGRLVTTSKGRQAKTYTARNRSKHDRTVLIEHPYTATYRLVSKAKPVEKTHDLLRFELKLPAGKSAALEVIEEWDVTGEMALSGCVEEQLRAFLKSVKSSDEVQQAVEKALALRGKLTTTQDKLGRLQGELREIGKDQERLRANLKEMPATAAAYKRYLAKFDKQETDIEKLQAEVRELQDVEARQRQEYEAYWGQVQIGPTPASATGEAPFIWAPVPTSSSPPPVPVTPSYPTATPPPAPPQEPVGRFGPS